jgi:hypothetical protein
VRLDVGSCRVFRQLWCLLGVGLCAFGDADVTVCEAGMP